MPDAAAYIARMPNHHAGDFSVIKPRNTFDLARTVAACRAVCIRINHAMRRRRLIRRGRWNQQPADRHQRIHEGFFNPDPNHRLLFLRTKVAVLDDTDSLTRDLLDDFDYFMTAEPQKGGGGGDQYHLRRRHKRFLLRIPKPKCSVSDKR